MRFLADGDVNKGPDHLPFSLTASGETVTLFSRDAEVLDQLPFGPQDRGISFGRLPDGSADYVGPIQVSTPGAVNDPDSDGDGLPDSWEKQHGFNPLNSADSQADPDKDGVGNLVEFFSGTNPNDARSYLRLQMSGGADQRLTFFGKKGQRYAIESVDLLGHTWAPLLVTETLGSDGEISAVDSRQGVSSVGRFYRLRIIKD
jgi:hypothetical protein